jgi:hypothetical protein
LIYIREYLLPFFINLLYLLKNATVYRRYLQIEYLVGAVDGFVGAVDGSGVGRVVGFV